MKLMCVARVGGPVGENNFKFFIQFVAYTTLYCLHLVIVMSIYVAKQHAREVRFMHGPSAGKPWILITLTSMESE
jgi:hypothetical protein